MLLCGRIDHCHGVTSPLFYNRLLVVCSNGEIQHKIAERLHCIVTMPSLLTAASALLSLALATGDKKLMWLSCGCTVSVAGCQPLVSLLHFNFGPATFAWSHGLKMFLEFCRFGGCTDHQHKMISYRMPPGSRFPTYFQA